VLGAHFFQKTGGFAHPNLSVTVSILCVTDGQELFGTSNSNIKQPPFLIEAIGVFQGHKRGKKAFLHACHENTLELQAFGSVDTHQGYVVGAFIFFIGIGE